MGYDAGKKEKRDQNDCGDTQGGYILQRAQRFANAGKGERNIEEFANN